MYEIWKNSVYCISFVRKATWGKGKQTYNITVWRYKYVYEVLIFEVGGFLRLLSNVKIAAFFEQPGSKTFGNISVQAKGVDQFLH
jgi:hypothetical protein